MTRSTKFWTVFFAGCWIGVVAGLLLKQPVLQAAFGAPIALVLPGLLILYLMNMYPARLERWSLVVALSVCVLIACVLGESLTSAGIEGITTLGLLGTVTLVLTLSAVIAARWRSRPTIIAERSAYAVAPAPPTPERRRPSRRALTAWSVSGVVVAIAIAGALGLSVVSESASAQPQFTQLSVTQQDDPDVHRVDVVNMEGVATQYQLQIVRPGGARTVQSFDLQPQETFSKEIKMRYLGRTDGQIVATLYGGSPTPLGYRQVKVTIPRQPMPAPTYFSTMR